MKIFVFAAALGAGVWACAAPALASWAANGVGATTSYPCVGKVGRPSTGDPLTDSFDCSGTVVGNGMFVLTAKHCITTDGTIGGPTMNSNDFRFMLGSTTYFADQIMPSPDADIAVVKLRGVMLSDAYQLYCPPTTAPPEDGLSLFGVGYGRGSSAGGTATSTWDLAYGTKREFRNLVDSVGPGPIAGQGTCLRYSLTIPGGVMGEGISGPGDSGGAVFINDGTGLKLAGVISSGPNSGPRPDSTASAVSVRAYKDWIQSRIPAPSSGSALVAIGVLAFRRRR